MNVFREYLKPVAKNHSVTRVIATCFLPQQVVDFDDLRNQLDALEIFKKYNRKSTQTTNMLQLNLAQGIMDKPVAQGKPSGLIMESFDQGKVQYVLQILNENNKAMISFEARVYDRWANFYEVFKTDLNAILETYPYYVEAVGLSYVDQFAWTHKDQAIPVREIFNPESELLNQKFLNSTNGSIVMVSQDQDLKNEEQVNISFNNLFKRVNINYQCTIGFKPYIQAGKILNENALDNHFDQAHESNKGMLRNLLSKTVLELIGING